MPNHSAPTGTTQTHRRRDYRALSIALLLGSVLAVGYVVQRLPSSKEVPLLPKSAASHPPMQASDTPAPVELAEQQPFTATADPREDPAGHVREARENEIKNRFAQALAMLHARRWDDALTALHRLLQLDPNRPEAYTNMGFAYLGKQEYQLARDFFEDSLNLDPGQANAYFGAAIAYEGLDELETAMSGMRSFLHLVDEPDPNQLHVAQARSALWEWEARLGKGPWGPTKGIMPGLIEEQVRRDGRGVATMIQTEPVEGKEDAWRFEIKHSDRIPGLFKP